MLPVVRASRRTNPAQLFLFDPTAPTPLARPVWASPWPQAELLCFDLETTGVDRFSDVPVSFALVRFRAGTVRDCTVGIVDPGRPIPPEATLVHGITTEQARRDGITLPWAVELIVEALVDASQRGVPVVGVKLDYDLTIIDVLCRRFDGVGLRDRGWRGPVLDVLVLDRHLDRYRKGRRRLMDLCALYEVTIDRAHTAECDAEAAGRVALSMAARYDELAQASLHQLHLGQVEYHRDWVLSFDQWRRGRGLEPLDPLEASWPLAEPPDASAGAA
jgi:DNA polymerase-3 subunit epsilon